MFDAQLVEEGWRGDAARACLTLHGICSATVLSGGGDNVVMQPEQALHSWREAFCVIIAAYMWWVPSSAVTTLPPHVVVPLVRQSPPACSGVVECTEF